ncbi:hypothetical protein RND81_11G072400 [Saponaria officinalis]|uniref:Uncharacterized protein n=1 Tax=Saponaria officinalis TaxID=3572 RepID=A0AAW1HIU6_SAPOF
MLVRYIRQKHKKAFGSNCKTDVRTMTNFYVSERWEKIVLTSTHCFCHSVLLYTSDFSSSMVSLISLLDFEPDIPCTKRMCNYHIPVTLNSYALSTNPCLTINK